MNNSLFCSLVSKRYVRHPPWKSKRLARFCDIHNCAQPGVGVHGNERYWNTLVRMARLEEAQRPSEKDW